MSMRKKIVSLLLTAALAASLAGCSSSDKAYLKNIKASNYVDVCDYVGIEIELAQPSVSDEEVESAIESDLSSDTYNEEVTDRDDVQDGDIVNIDYVGTLDGEEFDGGSSEGYELEIGSGTFIDGFEEGLIGCTVGETVDLDLTFPEDYSSEDLAGQDVVFTVTINSILQEVVPEFTDEWVQSLEDEDLQTTDDYWQYIYDDLMEDAQEDFDEELEELVVSYVLENSTMKRDVPDAMIERLSDSAISYYESYYNYMYYYYYDTFEDFMNSMFGIETSEEEDEEDSDESTEEETDESAEEETESDEEEEAEETEETEETESEEEEEAAYMPYIREVAEQSAKQLLVLKVISDREGLNPSKSEWETQLSVYAASYGYDSIEDFKENEDAESVREDMMIENVVEFLVDNCTVVEPSEEEESEQGAEEEASDSDEEEADGQSDETEEAAEDEED